MLTVENLRAGYAGVHVVHAVSFAVRPRSITGLLGTNGAGKSTVLRAISGRIPAQADALLVGATDVRSSRPHERARAGMCHVAEGCGVFRALTVAQNLRIFGATSDTTSEILAVFPRLRGFLHRTAGTLSGGEQQMLAIARVWATTPSVVLIDELSLGLADEFIDELLPAVTSLAERGASVVLVEQHLARVLSVADDIVLLQRGRVVRSGPREGADIEAIEAALLGADLRSEPARPVGQG